MSYYAKIGSRGMCAVQKISRWHFSILTFSYLRYFPSFLVLGLILVQTAVLAKDNKILFDLQHSFRQLLLLSFSQFLLLWYRFVKNMLKETVIIYFLAQLSEPKSNPIPKMKENIWNRKTPEYWNVILIFFAQSTSLWN